MNRSAVPELLLQIRAMKLPEPEPEFRFHKERRWRFDLAWPTFWMGNARSPGVAVEIDGGVFTGGRHTTGKGFTADLEKLNAAAELGWYVFRFTPSMVRSGEAIETLKRVLA